MDDLLHERAGDLEAAFVAPLTRAAPPGLGLIGLRHWHGKRFRRSSSGVEGVNLVRRSGGLEEVLPMTLAEGVSLVDGLPALMVSYASDAPRLWRWVRDEIRAVSDGSGFVGMTFGDLPGLRRLGGTPFLLRPNAF